jgi:hypothetical protein
MSRYSLLLRDTEHLIQHLENTKDPRALAYEFKGLIQQVVLLRRSELDMAFAAKLDWCLQDLSYTSGKEIDQLLRSYKPKMTRAKRDHYYYDERDARHHMSRNLSSLRCLLTEHTSGSEADRGDEVSVNL